MFPGRGPLVASVLSVAFLAAQSTTQSIEGLVTDTSGAVVANAKVTITNVATGVTSSVVFNSTGNYTFSLVPVGNYDVKAEVAGFKSEEVKGLVSKPRRRSGRTFSFRWAWWRKPWRSRPRR